MINTVETYTSLITSQHKDKKKFKTLVEVNTKFYVHLQSVLSSIPIKFDLENAVGHQLDVIGKWAGVSRIIKTPLSGVYFAWNDSANVGWNSGIWKSEFAPTSGISELPDDFYRTLIRAKIAANKWDGTIPGAYDIWEVIFTNNTIIIQDNQDMSIVVGISGDSLDALTRALLTGGYIPLKPEGVGVLYYALPGVEGPIFAWNTENNTGLAGWETGAWANILAPT